MSALEDLVKTGTMDNADIASVLGTTARSVQRWRQAGTDPARGAMLDGLLELKAVIDLALEVLPAASATLWMRAPVPELGYDKPLELIRDGKFRRVIDALTELAEGACT